jgi:hypothetical protein
MCLDFWSHRRLSFPHPIVLVFSIVLKPVTVSGVSIPLISSCVCRLLLEKVFDKTAPGSLCV